MADFTQFNTESKKTVKDGINTQDLKFVPLKDFIGKEIHVDGFFFTKGKYGEQVVVVGEGNNINLPKRFTDTFKGFRDNQDQLNAILAGGLKLVNIRELDAKEGKTVTFDYANA